MLIVFSGKARSGKDTAADLLQKHLLELYGILFNKVAYADELKKRIMQDFGLSHEQVYGTLKEHKDTRYPIKGTKDYWTPRQLMQFIGTDVYRYIDNNFWVNSLKQYIKSHPGNYIISDARFNNEIDWVLDAGGIHIRVVRNNAVSIVHNSHESETSLDNVSLDKANNYVLHNNGSSFVELLDSIEMTILPIVLGKIQLEKTNNYLGGSQNAKVRF